MLLLISLVMAVCIIAENTTFHQCYDEGEAYAASFLTTVEHLSSRNFASYTAKRTTELASFIMVETRPTEKRRADAAGTMMRTRDMLEFAVIHMSAIERTHRMERKGYLSERFLMNEFKEIATDQRVRHDSVRSSSHSASKTLAIMPWVGTYHRGDVGNSDVINRRIYLEASFWSIVGVGYQNVVIGCCFKEDLHTIQSTLKLPVIDALYIPECETDPQALPFLLLQATQRQLKQREDWKRAFKYVFFSESDQLLLVRNLGNLHAYLDTHPRRVLLPHRLIPYSREILSSLYGAWGLERGLPRLPRLSLQQAASSPWRCCLPTVSCSGNHSAMVPLKKALRTSVVPLLNVEGMLVVMGTANFWLHKFRFCQFQRREKGMCPDSLVW